MTELLNTELDDIDEVMNDIMEKKIFIESVEIEEGSKHLDYYFKRPSKYPELK